jgi:broad specificity phosphatase PhoE
MTELTLIRHGPSSHRQVEWINATGFRGWRESYEAAGILPDASPPEELRILAASAGALVASDAPRAVESAERLAPGRAIMVSPLLREMDLPAPSLGRLSLPLPAWALMVGLWSLYRRLRSLHPSPAELERAGEAARWLGSLASEHGPVVAVTHASFRKLLGRALVENGWSPPHRHRGLRHWSTWTFRPGKRSYEHASRGHL